MRENTGKVVLVGAGPGDTGLLTLKGENEIERSHYPILLQAQKAWENIEHFRQKRKRNRDYTYGKQWNDLIKLPDGRVVSEEQYIREHEKMFSEKGIKIKALIARLTKK